MNTYENETSAESILSMLGQTVVITKQNTESTAVIMEDLKNTKNLLSGLSRQVSNMNTSMTGVVDRMDLLELNEEVTTTQQETIIETATRRIVEILGNEAIERQKYFKIFIGRLYKDTRQCAGLGSKIARTKKGDFQRVVDFMEAWIPKCGCSELRSKADKNAEARKIARQEGYLD